MAQSCLIFLKQAIRQAARAVDCISVQGLHHQFCSHSMAQSCLIFLKQAIRQAARAVDCISVQGLHHQFCSHSMAQSWLIFLKQAIRLVESARHNAQFLRPSPSVLRPALGWNRLPCAAFILYQSPNLGCLSSHSQWSQAVSAVGSTD
jgi:hypothetical protein